MTVAFALALLLQAPQTVAGGANITEQLACAPMSLPAPPAPAIRVVGGYVAGRLMFGPGEPVVISGGSAKGIQVGQQFYVRRFVQDRFTPASLEFTPHSVHTTGWVTVVAVKDSMAIATITHACDAVFEGDYLEPYAAPSVPAVDATVAQPDFASPGRLVMADERRQMGYPGLMMLLNRGSDHGVRPGQSLTIFRETRNGEGPVQLLGAATVLTAYPQLSIVRIDSFKDAIFVGDLAAIHRITQ